MFIARYLFTVFASIWLWW